jgi:fimbrial chaperone protein
MKLLLLALALLPGPAHAFRLSPMVVDFSPSGKGATQTVLLENPDQERVAVQLEVTRRKVSEEGVEDRTEPAADFVVYPEQLVLEPGQKRNARLTWTGDAAPPAELAFRLVASQLPVALERPTQRADVKVNLKFVLQYVASLYVAPPGAKAEVVVAAAKLKRAGLVEVTVHNRGGLHRLLQGARLRIHAGKEDFAVPEAELATLRAQNLLAGGSRRFEIHVPKSLAGPLTAEIRFD